MKKQTVIILAIVAIAILAGSSIVGAAKPTKGDKPLVAAREGSKKTINDSKAGEATAPATATKRVTQPATTPQTSSPSPVFEMRIPVIDAPAETRTPTATDAATYGIPWQSINAGGTEASSPNYAVNGSVGQGVIGFATSTNYQAGIGYWYGAGGGCSCPLQGDVNGDGFIDSVDLSMVIDAIFFGGIDPQDPNCPATRADFNGDGFADSVDLSLVIDYVFFGGPGPTNPC